MILLYNTTLQDSLHRLSFITLFCKVILYMVPYIGAHLTMFFCKVLPYMAFYIDSHFLMIFSCKVLPYMAVYLDCHFIILSFCNVLPYMVLYIGAHFMMLFFCKVLPYMSGTTLHILPYILGVKRKYCHIWISPKAVLIPLRIWDHLIKNIKI